MNRASTRPPAPSSARPAIEGGAVLSAKDPLLEVIARMAPLPLVQREVVVNHDDNRWWPSRISDWRLRMAIACWSARVSYRMIDTYSEMVRRAEELGYEALAATHDDELLGLFRMVGLQHARLRVFRSLHRVLGEWERSGIEPLAMSNDDLIESLASEVDGAGYKLAQCAALYAKGYHCGVIPVDSGMADMLAPCLGIPVSGGVSKHEVVRKHLEREVASDPGAFRSVAAECGYDTEIQIPVVSVPTWWVHLVLVYFKRAYCNRREPDSCPLRSAHCSIGRMCDPEVGRRQTGQLWLV